MPYKEGKLMDALTTTQQTADNTRQYIVVKLANEQYGINIKYVDNIVRMQKITRVPKAQPYFIGVINLRGEIIPVMSLRRKFGLEEAEETSATRIIIVKPEQQAMVGLLVDSVKEVVTLGEDKIEKSSTIGDDNSGYISAVGKHEDGLISILSIQSVIIGKEQ